MSAANLRRVTPLGSHLKRYASNGASGASTTPTSSKTSVATHNLDTLRALVRKSDFESYLCGNLLPTSARLSFFVMRALNLELATVRDGARGNPMTGHVRMAFWKDFVTKAFKGEPIAHPLHDPLRAVIAQHGHTKRWLERLVEARDADLDGRAPSSIGELERYGEHTASSLMYLALEAVGVRNEQADLAASHIGRATALCTMLRALPVHSRVGQRYVPDELLAKYGLTEAELFVQPAEVFTAEGKPLYDPLLDQKDPSRFAEASASATLARAGGGFSHTGGIEFELGKPQPAAAAAHGHSHMHGPDCGHDHGHGHSHGAPAAPEAPPRGAGGLRMAGSRALTRAGTSKPTPGAQAPRPPTTSAKQDVGVNAQGSGPISPAEAAASAALRSGVGASQLLLRKSPETMAKIRGVTQEIAAQAREHINVARGMHEVVPEAAKAALLPAVPVSRFLDRLQDQRYDVFAAGGLGPWQDGRSYARLLLQLDVLKHTITNGY